MMMLNPVKMKSSVISVFSVLFVFLTALFMLFVCRPINLSISNIK